MSQWTHVAARKALGQHFLHDERVLAQIAQLAAPEPESGLVEIGPGTGNLTAHLLEFGRPVIAVERDRRMPAVLTERFAERFGADFDVRRADATRIDYGKLLRESTLGPRPVVVGNLPYNVGTEILFAVLHSPQPPARMVFMLQREVALRLVASPSTSAYGVLTVKVGMIADVQLALRVRPGAFTPPPRVESAVVVIRPLAAPRHAIPSLALLHQLVDAGFGLRRKTLSNALRSRLQVDPDVVRDALQRQGLDLRARAEALSIAQWAALAVTLQPHVPADRPGRARRSKRP